MELGLDLGCRNSQRSFARADCPRARSFNARPCLRGSRAKKVLEDFLGAFVGDFRPDCGAELAAGRKGQSALPPLRRLFHPAATVGSAHRDVPYATGTGDVVFAPDLRHQLTRACLSRRFPIWAFSNFASRKHPICDATDSPTQTWKPMPRGSMPASTNSCASYRPNAAGDQTPAHDQENAATSLRLDDQLGCESLHRHRLRHRDRPPPRKPVCCQKRRPRCRRDRAAPKWLWVSSRGGSVRAVRGVPAPPRKGLQSAAHRAASGR
jgi:hypothetical protein